LSRVSPRGMISGLKLKSIQVNLPFLENAEQRVKHEVGRMKDEG